MLGEGFVVVDLFVVYLLFVCCLLLLLLLIGFYRFIF